MSKVKARIITLLSLFMLIALVLGFVFSPVSLRKTSADSTYNITGGSDGIFAAKTTGGAKGEVLAYKSGDDAFVTFVIDNGGSVAYERDLALKWYTGTARKPEGVENYFNLVFSAVLKDGGIPFDTFSIEFESKEENVTKDGKATNSVVFVKGEGEGSLQAYVKNADFTGDKDAEEALDRVSIDDASEDITVSLAAGSSAGAFTVNVNGQKAGEFTNVGGNYLEYYSSSSSTPNVPMTFKATAAEGKQARIFVKELNRQSLKVTGGTEEETEDGVRVKDGKITDNADPVLVLNEVIYSYSLGQKFTHDCKVIDVCKKSISSPTHEYYMASHSGEGTDKVFVNPTAKKETSTDSDGNTVEKETGEFDGYKTLTTSTHFMPSDDAEREDFTEYVSIRVRLRDDRSETAWAYLHWYADDDAKEMGTDADSKEFPYIKVENKKEGPYYIENGNGIEFDNANGAYQQAVTAAANKEGVSAGSGAYFYLPSLRNLIKSNYADYRNLKFSIYYYKQSQAVGATAGSATSLKYNALRFQIDEAGTYRFRVLATDAAGNAMTFPQGDDKKDVTVTSSNIWELEGYPEYTFEVKYNGVKIEEMKEQTAGNRESSYSVTDFTIIALSGIQKEYSLYYVNEDNLKEGASLPTYSDLVKTMNEVKSPEAFAEFCAKYDISAERKCITEISKFNSEVEEDDDDWDKTDNAYRWNPSSSLSFVPQKSGFYIVGITVTDPNRSNESHVAYQAINIGNPYDYTPAPSDWLQNNLVSVILFSISGVLLIAIVVLFIVKPSDKKVEEIDLDKLKGKKKKK